MKGKLYITCAAIHFDDGKKHVHVPFNIETGFVVCGHRHHNCFAIIWDINNESKLRNMNETQGFMTSHNTFVNREDAAVIARNAVQIEDESIKKLFSEDIY